MNEYGTMKQEKSEYKFAKAGMKYAILSTIPMFVCIWEWFGIGWAFGGLIASIALAYVKYVGYAMCLLWIPFGWVLFRDLGVTWWLTLIIIIIACLYSLIRFHTWKEFNDGKHFD
ncbi:hypothetical protein [Aureibacillus halotolerans]|uniref:Uncharacterized protein n=1 Tax=Aureibacillus halotolerans TaxID=1508390 RepID=A0A4R6TYJ4_9BACI|nr:hypothetical protein [Aureibacillus halotolerans]TDQ35285.1 hypothetical protein EV213_12272 [Aureibacillus halotolerans]